MKRENIKKVVVELSGEKVMTVLLTTLLQKVVMKQDSLSNEELINEWGSLYWYGMRKFCEFFKYRKF